METYASVSDPTLDARLALREEPATPALMYQEWHKLLFLHWQIDPALLQQHLPDGLTIDTFDGNAWIGVVPFYMRNVRPRFLPAVPGISNFLELNVRTYVFDREGIPGVWFFSLDANSRIGCTLGRSLFKLAYRDAAMTAIQDGDWIDYSTLRHGEKNEARFRYRGSGPSRKAEPGTLEFFLVERYLLFSHSGKTGRFFRGRVHHRPYEFQDAEVEDYSDLPAIWDEIPTPGGTPDHALFVDSVKVRIFGVERSSD